MLWAGGCAETQTVEATQRSTNGEILVTHSAIPATPISTATDSPQVSIPDIFQSDLLREGIEASSYINDRCSYLAMRWDPDNSQPGTVIAPIMFHAIYPYGADTEGQPSAINQDTFDAIIQVAEKYGFETITSEDLAAFLTRNAKIPTRALMLIMDDRTVGSAEEFLLPVAKANNWTATLAWPIGDTDIRTGLWGRIETLNETGYFDIQSHGLNHIYINDSMDEEIVREEIFGSIPILKEHFGKEPIVYVWPGGDYTALGVDLAVEAGFQLGFTVQSRGPILFNWIPQGEKERAIEAPLMLLPRFWSSAATLNLTQTVETSEAAIAFAKENYASEAAWYLANCGGTLTALNLILPE
ncbi:MAG: hypothetical protein DWG76_01065 [Chloroflexi bacterium]|nr:hypothetical protein [Chloroflexota bacterium]